MAMNETATVVQIDLDELAQGSGTGPVFGHETEDLDLTLLRWKEGHRIETHSNDEVDVVMIVLEGEGRIIVNGETYDLEPGRAVIIPKGAMREVQSQSDGFAYLNIHKRRRRLMPTLGGRPK
jgi:mannose-6-phosphate isomerase-like protein (cupin superfamily)